MVLLHQQRLLIFDLINDTCDTTLIGNWMCKCGTRGKVGGTNIAADVQSVRSLVRWFNWLNFREILARMQVFKDQMWPAAAKNARKLSIRSVCSRKQANAIPCPSVGYDVGCGLGALHSTRDGSTSSLVTQMMSRATGKHNRAIFSKHIKIASYGMKLSIEGCSPLWVDVNSV